MVPGSVTADLYHRTTITGGRVVTPTGLLDSDVVISGDRIVTIGNTEGVRGGTLIDAVGLLVVPGLIDVQVNGGFGYDFTSHPGSIWEVGSRLPAFGVTAFLPTIVTSPTSTIISAQDVLRSGPPSGYVGAVPLGLHLEGPMLSPHRLGTHDPAYVREPHPELIEGWSPDGEVRMVTLAPELPGVYPIIEELCRRGVVVSLGHSEASYDQAIEAIRLGASFGTHLYNAMPPIHPREPGLTGALLSERDIAVGMIVDGFHVHPATVRLAWEAKKPDHFVLATDAMAALGMGHGTYQLGSVRVNVGDIGPRNDDGALAGSVLSLDEAVRNLVAFTSCEQLEAVSAATANPSRLLGDPQRGRIEVGRRSDLTLLDTELKVKATIVGGRVAFADPSLSIIVASQGSTKP